LKIASGVSGPKYSACGNISRAWVTAIKIENSVKLKIHLTHSELKMTYPVKNAPIVKKLCHKQIGALLSKPKNKQ
jgi:hypothetical protein